MKTLLWILVAVLCLIIGAYPLTYLVFGGKFGLLQTKSDTLLINGWWRLGFYVHIVGAGIALFVGWTQFVKSLRTRYSRIHRNLGKLYVLMVVMSGVAAICIAPYCTTGPVAGFGFGSLGVVWLYFTVQAYRSVLQRDLRRHECLMIYSYSACMSAVTLRLWLPLLARIIHVSQRFRLDGAISPSAATR